MSSQDQMRMLLVFQPGSEPCALDCRYVVEVIPRLPLSPPTPETERTAGTFAYRGRTVPAVDLSQVLNGRDSANLMSTRIVVVRADSQSDECLLGLIVERAVQFARVPAAGPSATAGAASPAPFVRETVSHQGKPLHILDAQRLVEAFL